MTRQTPTFERVQAAFRRNARVLSRRPSVGRGIAVTTVRMTDGLCCEIVEGDRRLACDMPAKHGGTDTGPNPGMLGRGALGACVAMGIVRWAALEGVQLESLTVRVEADYDAGGEFGVSDVRPGYDAVRVVASVESTASDEDLDRIVPAAIMHTSFVDLFTNGTDVRTEVRRVKDERKYARPSSRGEVTE